jgi:regulator of cell morphogenesis and NO signaling
MGMTTTSTTTLADMAVTHPAAARVFYRHGLDFCCGGRRPIAEACAIRGIDVAALLAEIDNESATTADQTRWDQAPLDTLVAFIVDTYHRRLRETFPDLLRMAARVEQRHGDKASCPRGLTAHLEAMHAAVLEHLDKEEQVLFPMIVSGRGQYAAGPAHVMEVEHDDHARSLEKLRALTNNMQPPAEACTTWRALYLALRQFEEELMTHIHLENNVLFRRALAV